MPADSAGRLYGAQILGRRARQEDAFAAAWLGGGACLAIVADGLGGHPAGDVASREALEVFQREFRSRRESGGGENGPGGWMQDSLIAANRHLMQRQSEDPELAGMATTFVAAYLDDLRLSAVSVGDSYLLVLRAGQLVRLNTLHAAEGGITSSVGFNLSQMDLANAIAVEEGDRLLLATDGVAILNDADLARILREAGDAEDAVHAVLAAVEALEHPQQDNATAVALFV